MTPAAKTTGTIGPNAITRVAEALGARGEESGRRDAIFRAAGLAHYLEHPPTSLVDEQEVTRLHQVMRSTLGIPAARDIADEAGRRTGDYLLAHRIPQPVQPLLRFLPAPVASRILLKAVAKNAWTFSGSGDFTAEPSHPPRVSIAGCPLCRGAHADQPLCDFFGATFEHLFRQLVHPHTRVEEIACQATGDPACVFELSWRPHPG